MDSVLNYYVILGLVSDSGVWDQVPMFGIGFKYWQIGVERNIY